MIFRVGMISRREDLTELEFREHWRSVHGVHASKMPGLRWYRQNHIVSRYYEIEPWPIQPVDGLSQLQFDSVEDMELAEASPAYAETKMDIPNFQGSITILVISPSELIAGPRDGCAKLIILAQSDEERDIRDSKAATRELICGTTGLASAVYYEVIDKSHPVAAGVPSGEPNVDAFIELFYESDGARDAAVKQILERDSSVKNSALLPIAVYGIEEYIVV